MPFGTVMTKLKLFHVVERKMYHVPFVNSTKSLIFDLTKIYGTPNTSEVTSIFVDNQKFVADNQKFVLTIRKLC